MSPESAPTTPAVAPETATSPDTSSQAVDDSIRSLAGLAAPASMSAEPTALNDDDPDGEPSGATPSEASAEGEDRPGPDPEASKSDEGQPAGGKVSRRAKPNAIAAKEAELAEARAAGEAAERARVEAEGRAQAYQREIAGLQAEATRLLGEPARVADLRARRDRAPRTGEWLTAAEEDELAGYVAAAEIATPFYRDAELKAQARAEGLRSAVLSTFAAEAQTVTERYGLDPDVVRANPSYAGVIGHAVEVTEQRLAEEHKAELDERDERISQLEADLERAPLARLGFARRPAPGEGRSAGGGPASIDDRIRIAALG